MKTEILISCDDWENRVAVLEEGALAEIYFEREEKVIGSIYKARVENVLPGMGACFVNIGLGRNAFLYVDDILRDPINIGETEITDRRRGNTVGELLRVGDEVLVQIIKEPRGLKGARVSTNISLPGRYLVLMPTGRYSGVSSKIDDSDERDRLKQIMRRVRPEGMATIVRTAAERVSEAELIADLGVQLRLWHGILDSYQRATAPALLHKDLNLIFKAVRDFMTGEVEQVLIDSKEQFDEIRSTMSLLGPQYISRLKLWEGPGNLFESRGIDEELQKLLKPKIQLPSGGHLMIEQTEALTVVDVNTGKFVGGRNLEDTLVKTNLEAAAEIARQVRLRDIGGIIVVDFIDMAHERSRQQVIDTLTGALKRDRTRSTIQAFSNLGLLEFTRKRVGKDLAGQLRSDCPYCGGLGDVMSAETLAIGLLRRLREAAADGGRGRKLDVVVDPSVAAQLAGWYRDEVRKLAETYKLEMQLFVEPHRHREQPLLEAARRQPRPLTAGRTIEAELLGLRMPDPAAGVAVVDENLIEVKDASGGAGQTVKIKITSADGLLTRAELAEPLRAGKRRRGRRGKAAAEAEEAVVPPPPVERATVAAAAYGVEPEEEAAARRARRPRARRAAPERRRELPAVVVGGEGDIDFEDESTAIAAPAKSEKRRHGRGRRADSEARIRESAAGERRETEVEEETEVGAEAPHARAPRIFGPIRQIYGAPLDLEAQRVSLEAPRVGRREDETSRRSRLPAPDRRRSATRAKSTKREPDDLAVVIEPKRPATLRVKLEGAPYRTRPERARAREEPAAPRRAGASVRQVYPPPGFVEEAAPEGEEQASPPARSAKPTRGPLLRDPNAPPLPKGKVRQLYPPPEVGQSETSQSATPSLFIKDEAELEERRRRARDRAAQREARERGDSVRETDDES